MANTKKEHYVPQCYLRYFCSKNERINVFDKEKMEIRTNQDISNVAENNHFYDLNLFQIYKKVELSEQAKIKTELAALLGSNDIETALKDIDSQQYIEKQFFSEHIESIYSPLLKKIINKSYNGNQWVIKNCFAFSESEKELFAFFIAIQIIRTKSFRETMGSTIEQFVETTTYKSQINDEDALPKQDFQVSVDKEYVKLQHNQMLLDPEMTLKIAETLIKHIWVIYVNKTNIPFYTSDDPVVNVPHKNDAFLSYAGLNSEGIEILFPISPNLLLGMYHSKTYKDIYADRKFMAVNNPELVKYFNKAQVIHSQRYIFSNSCNFDLAKKACQDNPDIQIFKPRIKVL